MNRNLIAGALVLPIAALVIWFAVTSGQKGTPTPGASDQELPGENSGSGGETCVGLVAIGEVSVEKDPAGEPEAWVRINYTTTVNRELSCQYVVTILDSQGSVVREITTEDNFQYPSGQLSNGYSDTPYQPGMTATATIK